MAPPVAQTPPKPIRTPVKRAEAESYLLISLVCFGVTVVMTRVYWEWAGYPQIGNDVLHIAPALWGGLLLFLLVGYRAFYLAPRGEQQDKEPA